MIAENENKCVVCGATIPKGRQTCHDCARMKEHIEILERALSQSQKTLQGAGEEIKRLDKLIEEQKTTIKVLASTKVFTKE